MISRARRLVLALILALFILQFFGIEILKGNLVSSIFLNKIYLFDVFSGIETILSSKRLEINIILGILTVTFIYVIFGRAFCGWICPLDAVFSYIKGREKNRKTLNPAYPAVFFLTASLLLSQPIFASYISPVSNFFRIIYSPFLGSISLLIFSGAMILPIILMEILEKRFWCKNICPIGFIYGKFNKISLIGIKIDKNACIDCKACVQACPMDVEIKKYSTRIRSSNCILCGICVEKCEKNALKFGG